MKWKEHFRGLRNLKKESSQAIARERKEEETEIRKINKAFTPRMRKVCKEFAKAIKWDYSETHCGQGITPSGNEFHMIKPPVGITVKIYIKTCHNLEVISRVGKIPPHTIVVTFPGYESSFFVRAITCDEFTEEKLAKVLEDAFRSRFDIKQR